MEHKHFLITFDHFFWSFAQGPGICSGYIVYRIWFVRLWLFDGRLGTGWRSNFPEQNL